MAVTPSLQDHQHRHRCVECDKGGFARRPVVQHIDGTIEYVCPTCWDKFEYAVFMHRDAA